jgi:glycosyltransferase involved in cell wall biosynthesis
MPIVRDTKTMFPRVLIIAEHASARYGGEAMLPLHYFRLLRRRGVQAWLLVHERTRAELEELLPDQPGRIHYVPDTWAHKVLFALGKPLPHRISLFTVGFLLRLLSQLLARHKARALLRTHSIDIVHQPIPVSPKETSVLHGLGVPVVMGPMNGGMEYPPGFRRREGRAEWLFTSLGRWVAPVIHWLFPGKLRAATLLVANERTRRALPPGVQGQIIELVENSVDLATWQGVAARPRTAPVRFLFTGRLVDFKAVDLLLEAFAQVVKQTAAELHIIGDGPMRAELEARAAAADLAGQVTFHGWLPQAEAGRHMREADVFVFPSLFDCGGSSVLEAMAAGLPIVASAWGGPADYVTPECGILVEPTSVSSFIDHLSQAMLKLAGDPEQRRRLGQAARQRAAQEFDWDHKIERMLAIYAATLQRAQGAIRSAENERTRITEVSHLIGEGRP